MINVNKAMRYHNDKFTYLDDSLCLSTTMENTYIPLHFIKACKVFVSADGNKIAIYELPRIDNYYYFIEDTRKRNKIIKNLLTNSSDTYYYRSGLSVNVGQNIVIQGLSSLLYTQDGTILVALCLPVSKAMNLNGQDITDSDVVLIADKRLNNVEFKGLKKHLDKYFFPAYENIDILWTKSVNKYCMNPVRLIPSFSSLNGLTDYLTNMRNFYGTEQLNHVNQEG